MYVAHRKIKQRKRNQGFSIIELVAAMIIMGLLAGVATVGVMGFVKKAKVESTRTNIGTLETAIKTFHLECGFYPTSLDELITPPSGRNCRGYPQEGFLEKKEVPLDAWGSSFNFSRPGTHNTTSYDLWSNGADAEEGTADDITNWKSETDEG